MANRNIVSLGDVIFDDIDKNPYLNELYENILYNYSLRLFQIKSEYKPVNISDALRFADILSKSPADSHMTWAQEMVALLKEIEPNNPEIDIYLNSVLSNTGNYQGLETAENKKLPRYPFAVICLNVFMKNTVKNWCPFLLSLISCFSTTTTNL